LISCQIKLRKYMKDYKVGVIYLALHALLKLQSSYLIILNSVSNHNPLLNRNTSYFFYSIIFHFTRFFFRTSIYILISKHPVKKLLRSYRFSAKSYRIIELVQLLVYYINTSSAFETLRCIFEKKHSLL